MKIKIKWGDVPKEHRDQIQDIVDKVSANV